MCGIAGVFHRDGAPADADVLRRMAATISHRGPDATAVKVFDGGCGLAHTRLKILDLSEAAAQPLANDDGTIWVSFNGEIYNFAALREELAAKGHRFGSTGDTE